MSHIDAVATSRNLTCPQKMMSELLEREFVFESAGYAGFKRLFLEVPTMDDPGAF